MRTKKVVLIRPQTVTNKYVFVGKQFPLNLAGLASFLIAGGVQTRIWDFDVEDFTEDSFGRAVKEYAPDVVGISCCTPSIINGHAIASAVKKINAKILTVLGGPHVSAIPERTLAEFPDFDAAVVGEGEHTLLDLVRADEYTPKNFESIPGLAFRSGGQTVRTPPRELIRDLDSLPFPARDLLSRHLYRGQSHRGFSRDFLKITELVTSRGCPAKCAFCAADVVMGKALRFRSAENVRQEVVECIERFGFRHFTIFDDTFTLNLPRLTEICGILRELKVTWTCSARAWPISEAMISMLAKSGCTGITFGVESGSQRVLDLIDKKITVQQVRDAFALAHKAGIRIIEADFIIGSHPSETMEDVNLSRKIIREIKPDVIMVSVIVPYPGTAVYGIMKEKGLLNIPEKWDEYVLFGGFPSWRTEHFSPQELIALQKKMLREFYMNPATLVRRILAIRSFKEFKYWFKTGTSFLLKTFKRAA